MHPEAIKGLCTSLITEIGMKSGKSVTVKLFYCVDEIVCLKFRF